MTMEWPTRRTGGRAQPNLAPWFIRLPTDDLRLLRAINQLGGGRVPPWAESVVADLEAKAADAPERPAPPPPGPRPEDLLRGSDDFAAALAAAWPRAEPSTRDALRTVAAALGIEVPADPIPEPAVPPPERAREADDDPPGDRPTPEPETAPTAIVGPPPAKPRRTVWGNYWSTGDEDDRKTSLLEWANKFRITDKI